MTVYTPREDSIMVKEYIERMDLQDKKFLDVGTGSGIQALTAARKGAEVTAIDLNCEAVDYTDKRAEEEDLDVKTFQSDLFDKVEDTFDVVVFNPPYLPGKKGIGDENIWRGGETGLETVERFLKEVESYLNSGGTFITVLSSETDWESVRDRFNLEIAGSEKLWFETVYLAVKT